MNPCQPPQLGDIAQSAGVATLVLTQHSPNIFDAAALAASVSARYHGALVLSEDLTAL